jgi:hypothetical protein
MENDEQLGYDANRRNSKGSQGQTAEIEIDKYAGTRLEQLLMQNNALIILLPLLYSSSSQSNISTQTPAQRLAGMVYELIPAML